MRAIKKDRAPTRDAPTPLVFPQMATAITLDIPNRTDRNRLGDLPHSGGSLPLHRPPSTPIESTILRWGNPCGCPGLRGVTRARIYLTPKIFLWITQEILWCRHVTPLCRITISVSHLADRRGARAIPWRDGSCRSIRFRRMCPASRIPGGDNRTR